MVTEQAKSHNNESNGNGKPQAAAPAAPSANQSTKEAQTADYIDTISDSNKLNTYQHRRGYSSGESSDTDSEHDESINRKRTSTIEVFDLCSIKSTVHADGNLTGKVVRMETPFGKPIEEIYDGVHTGPVLGSGVSGIVRLVTHITTGVKYAVKVLDLGLIKSAEGLQQLREEIYIMCQLDHPNIVRLEEVYESLSEIYLVLELCLGGDLFDRLDEQPDYHYTEAQCARLVKQMLSSVRYLHSKNIIHRDLKLENFLFSTTEPESVLKMIDFGLSKHFSFDEEHSEAVGTPYTVAPEIIKGSYNEKCDIWAVGVITFLLLSGDTPFGGIDGEDLLEVRENILRASIAFEPTEVWDNVSDLAKDFVRTTLAKDATDRPNAKGAQRHKWIQTYSKKKNDEGNKLNPNVVKALVGFKEFSDMRKLLCEVLSFTLLPEQINDLRVEFEKFDEGDGEISLADLKQVLLESAEDRTLGGMTEVDVEDIFNALRVRKSETKIRWHEFIAAGLSQCKVDERNLKLAFDRIDNDRKGYITFDNVMDLVGETDASENKEEMKMMWMESIKHIKGDLDRITVDDFMLVMKGQALGMGGDSFRNSDRASKRNISTRGLDIVPEGQASPQIRRTVNDFARFEGSSSELMLHSIPMLGEPADPFGDLAAAPKISHIADSVIPEKRAYMRLRSRSLEHNKTNFFEDNDDFDEEEIRGYLRPSMLLPVRRNIETVMEDNTMSPLMVNRAIYRAHREMRLGVMEASKRFEEKQKRHELNKKLEEAGKRDGLGPGIALVMRRRPGSVGHGSEELKPPHKEVHDEQEQEHAAESKKSAEEAALDSASTRSGRPRRNRKKTCSDMTGMLAKIEADEQF